MRQALLPLLLVLLALGWAPGARSLEPGHQQPRVYAVWPHSDYKPWQADVYARDPGFVLRELDWMREVGINTYLPLALASGRVKKNIGGRLRRCAGTLSCRSSSFRRRRRGTRPTGGGGAAGCPVGADPCAGHAPRRGEWLWKR